MKILVIRLSSIGDIVLTSPVVRVLKKQLQAEVHFLTKKTFANWLCHNPYIDKIHNYEKGTAPLLSENFDLVVDLHHNLRTFKIKSVLKLPSTSVNKLNIRKFILTTLKLNFMPPIHMVDRNIATIEHLGIKNDMQGLDFFIPEKESLPKPFNFTKPYVAVVIGGQHPTKVLPNYKLIELCQGLSYDFVLIGGPEDKKRGDDIIQQSAKGLNACGQLSLTQSALLVKGALYVVSHDTGMMHISAALKKKIYSVWGNTVPAFGMVPYLAHPSSQIIENKKIACRPCSKIGYAKCPRGHFKCMNEIDLSSIR